jgi:hypothetical protein
MREGTKREGDAMNGRVYVIERGEYDQRFVWGVASSPEAAEAAIKERYGPPFVIRWEPLERDVDHSEDPPIDFGWVLTGHFEMVPGYSTQHTSAWAIEPFELIASKEER